MAKKVREKVVFFSHFFLSFFDCQDIFIDQFKAADSKYGLSFALSSMFQNLGKNEPQVKKTSC